MELHDAQRAFIVVDFDFASLFHQRENATWILEADRFDAPRQSDDVNVMGKQHQLIVELDAEECVEAHVVNGVVLVVDRLATNFVDNLHVDALRVCLIAHVANVILLRHQSTVYHHRVDRDEALE